MKLIKINTDHYIIVDDSEVKEGDWVYCSNGNIKQITKSNINDKFIENWKKIIQSTQPLECDKMWTPVNGKQWMCNTMLCCGKILNPKTKPISLQEVKELIGEVDVEKKADDIIPILLYKKYVKTGFIGGYNQALEDNKEKKYTEENLRRYHNIMCLYGNVKGEEYIQSLQPKTSWEVEIIDGKLKLN